MSIVHETDTLTVELSRNYVKIRDYSNQLDNHTIGRIAHHHAGRVESLSRTKINRCTLHVYYREV